MVDGDKQLGINVDNVVDGTPDLLEVEGGLGSVCELYMVDSVDGTGVDNVGKLLHGGGPHDEEG